MTNLKKMEYHQKELDRLAMEEVKNIAKKILNRCSTIEGFCMGMGCFSFSDKNGLVWDDDKRIKEMEDFMQDWGYDLMIMGIPYRIDKQNGSFVERTEW